MSTKVNTQLTNSTLDALANAFAGTPEPLAQGQIPDADYTAEFTGVETRTTDKQQIPVIDLNFDVTGPREEFMGAPVRSQFFIREGKRDMEFFKKTARAMGVKSDDFNQVLDELNALIGTSWRIRVKNNGKYSNVYVNGAA